MKHNPVFLFLQDGTYCQGWSLFTSVFSVGEIVFNTAMTGYQEVMTDPSYCNQIILFTYPELGNAGLNTFDIESTRLHINGIIAKNICLKPSNWRIKLSLVNYLVSKTIPHVFGIDTRYLVKYLRSKGVMYACISDHQLVSNAWSSHIIDIMAVDMVKKVTTTDTYRWKGCRVDQFSLRKFSNKHIQQITHLHVIVIDFGVKFNILRYLSIYGCHITIVSALEEYNKILAMKPDGILLSNGPGDPALVLYAQYTINKLLETNIPIFGICLGHQLLSLCLGATTSKMKFGHRGLNHPASIAGKVQLTSQNHGFVVDINTLPPSLVNIMSFNLNDHTVAGIIHKFKPFFSVQYHPEANPGPRDASYLFTHFVQIMHMSSLSRKNYM